MDLTLNLNGEYFDAIKNGKKKEEFRVFDKWRKRLLDERGEHRVFDNLIICRGYPKKTDKEKRMTMPWRGFEIREIKHPFFGDDPVVCFCIRCGGNNG